MNKKRLLLIALVVAAIAGYFVWDQMLRTAPSMKKLDAEYRVNAVEFFSEFDENEEAANVKYLNKIVEVVGEVEDVNLDDGNPVLSLKTEGFGTVRCTMESEMSSEELDKVKHNSTLVVRGEVIGKLLDVDLERCIVVEPN